jgi:hypothetical protein
VSAHGNAMVACHPDGTAHDDRIAGVIAAGDVRRADALHELGIVAERPAPEGFPEIGVEVDGQDPARGTNAIAVTGRMAVCPSSGQRRRPREGSQQHGHVVPDERCERFPLPVDIGPITTKTVDAEPSRRFTFPVLDAAP